MQASWSWSLYVWVPRPPTGCLPDGTRVSSVEVHRMPGERYGAKGSKCSKTCHRVEYLKQIMARHLIWRIDHKSQQEWECDRVISNSGSKLGLTAVNGIFDVLPVLLWPVLAAAWGWPHEIQKQHVCWAAIYAAQLPLSKPGNYKAEALWSSPSDIKHSALSLNSKQPHNRDYGTKRRQSQEARQEEQTDIKDKKRGIGSLTFPDGEAFHLRRCLILHCLGLQFDILFFFLLVQFQPQQQRNWPEICFCAWNFNSITSLLLYSTEIQS